MFPSLISPVISPLLSRKDGKPFNRKPKMDSGEKYTSLTSPKQPVISRSRMTMRDFQRVNSYSFDSDEEEDNTDERAHSYSKHLEKSTSVESAPSSDESSYTSTSNDPDPIEQFHQDTSNNCQRMASPLTKIRGKGMKSFISTLSPKLAKKQVQEKAPTAPSQPVWPNSINTFARGVTTSKEQQTITSCAGDEPSIYAMRVQIQLQEKENIRNGLQILVESLKRAENSEQRDPDLMGDCCHRCRGADHADKRKRVVENDEGLQNLRIHQDVALITLTPPPPDDEYTA